MQQQHRNRSPIATKLSRQTDETLGYVRHEAKLGLPYILLCILALVLLAMLLPTRSKFSVASPAKDVTLINFDPGQQLGGVQVRHLQAGGEIDLPASGPGRYRLKLTVRDTAVAPGQQAVAVTINGLNVGSLRPDSNLDTYTFHYDLVPAAWQMGGTTELQIGFLVPPTATAQQATLPFALAAIEVAPESLLSSLYAELLTLSIPLLLLLFLIANTLTKYMPRKIPGGGVVLLLLIVGAVLLPQQTLFVAYQLGLHPLRAGSAVVVLLLFLIASHRLPTWGKPREPRESACRRWRTGGDANRGMLPPAWVAGTAVALEPGAP